MATPLHPAAPRCQRGSGVPLSHPAAPAYAAGRGWGWGRSGPPALSLPAGWVLPTWLAHTHRPAHPPTQPKEPPCLT